MRPRGGNGWRLWMNWPKGHQALSLNFPEIDDVVADLSDRFPTRAT